MNCVWLGWQLYVLYVILFPVTMPLTEVQKENAALESELSGKN